LIKRLPVYTIRIPFHDQRPVLQVGLNNCRYIHIILHKVSLGKPLRPENLFQVGQPDLTAIYPDCAIHIYYPRFFWLFSHAPVKKLHVLAVNIILFM
jgi:hypothetical protein